MNNSNNFTFVDKREESKEKLHKMYLEMDNSSHHSSIKFNLMHNIRPKLLPMDSYRSGACSIQPPLTAIDTYRTTKDVVLADLDAAADSQQSLMSHKDKEFEVIPELHTFQKEEEEFNNDENGPTTLISHLNDPNNEFIVNEE